MKKKIAITGGIGSGKSTLLQYIREEGYPVFSCDELYKEVLDSPQYIEKIANRFPKCVVEGKIDKAKLAATVFQKESERLDLNAIAHPLIMQALEKQMENCEEDLVFAEVPLLFEGGYQSRFDEVIVLLRGDKERIASVTRRDGLLPQEVVDRISVQFHYRSPKAQEIFKECNAIVLDNNQTETELKEKLQKLLASWR